METKLVTITDLQKIKPISGNIDSAKRIDPYVIEAQDLDIRPFLGAPLFYDLIKDVQNSPTSAIYTKLLDGGEYTSLCGDNVVYFDGLKIAISYFAYARFLKNQNTNVTAFGVVRKSNDYSDPLPKEEIEALVSAARENALAYLYQVEDFLDSNKATYPLWGDVASSKPRGTIKITAVKNY